MTPLGPGLHFDVPSAVYFGDPAPAPSLNQSLAKVLLDQSPRHAWIAHPRLNPEFEQPEETYSKPRAIGNAAHALLLGRGKEIAVAEFKDWRTKDAQAFRKEAEAVGKIAILAEHHTAARMMELCAYDQLQECGWGDVFRDGQSETVAIWQEDGLYFRTMIDWHADLRAPVDYKTGGGSFAPHEIGVKIVADGWDVQAAMHERALDALDPEGCGRRTFRYVCQENYPPYALVPVEMTEAHMVMGRKKLAVAMDIWRKCMTRKIWPAYPSRIVRPDYPGFAETKWLEREQDYASAGITGENFWKAGELLQPAEVE